MSINLPQEHAEALKDGMDMGGGVKLPFDVTYWYVVNGDRKMRQAGGVHYFGGWATDIDKVIEAGLSWDPPITYPPSYSYQGEVVTNSGKSLPSYLTRSLIVVPIGFRECWESRDQGAGRTMRFKDYQPGTRRHAQFLVYVADKNEQKQLSPWAPAVLTVGGMQVSKVYKAFQDWKNHIEKARRILEPNAPSWVFYAAIGTFGDEPKVEMVGQNGAQSGITPMVAQLPENMTPELLEKLYVGADVVTQMAELKADAQEWLHAWDNLGQQAGGQRGGNNWNMPAPPANFDDQFPPISPEDESPF